jgi:uncharacterized protein (TIGR03435 family)
MKKLPLLMMVLTTPLLAQNMLPQSLAGTWQGTLQPPQGGEQRIVLKVLALAVSPGDVVSLKAVFYNIDQPGAGIPVSAIALSGLTVKMSMPGIGGSFEGKFSADGNSIAGTWTQGRPIPSPLNLVRVTPEAAWTIPAPPAPATLMPGDAAPSFEVATIKPGRSEEGISLKVSPSGMFTTTGTSLTDLIKFAFDLHPRQIAGGPAWLETEKYDVAGKPDRAGMPNATQLKAMLRNLLLDRFKLEFHREMKELSAYAITIAKGGARLTKNDTNPNGLPTFGVGRGNLTIRNSTMAEFASVLQAAILDRPAVDQTALGPARYDFALKWTPDAVPAPDPDAPPDLFAAFEQQLGLRLQSTKAPVDVLIIDRVEKPSEN